ncbi:MAG: HAMP domain-containing sensor histidine kinase [bacterium]
MLFNFKKKQNKKSESIMEDGQFKHILILALIHNLSTPLTGARWALDSIMGSQNKNKNPEILNEGYNKILSAINIVEEIFKVEEINSTEGHLNLKKEKIDLSMFIDNIIKNYSFLIKKKEIILEFNKKDEPIIFYGDKKILSLIFTNLFDNTFRYSQKGKVIIDMNKEKNMVKFTIKDSGIGIDKEDLKHIFEKFYRGKNAELLDPDRSGIGLFIVKKIIEKYQGSISINSEINSGTIIEVKLPILNL